MSDDEVEDGDELEPGDVGEPLEKLSIRELDAILKHKNDPRYADAKKSTDELLKPLGDLVKSIGGDGLKRFKDIE